MAPSSTNKKRGPQVGRAVFFSHREKVRLGLIQGQTVQAIFASLGPIPLSYSQFARYAKRLNEDLAQPDRSRAATSDQPTSPAAPPPPLEVPDRKAAPAGPRIAKADTPRTFQVNPKPDPSTLI